MTPSASTRPLASIIIPTIRRPELVLRAVHSALKQTYSPTELLVVIDGPDPATTAALAGIADPRLHILQNERSLGAGPARNRAAAEAAGAWLAFLDDDDEWLPLKLERQLDGRTPDENVILACQCRVHTSRGTHIWPTRAPGIGERLDDYLFRRRSLTRGEAYLATPALVIPTWLFRAAGGFGSTAQNEDRTLQLRAARLGARLEMLLEPMVVVHAEDPGRSTGTNFDWREQLDWLDEMGDLIGGSAYSGFCLVVLGSQAARVWALAAIPELLRRAFIRGKPTAVQLALFAGFWFMPAQVRQGVRQLVHRGRRAPC